MPAMDSPLLILLLFGSCVGLNLMVPLQKSDNLIYTINRPNYPSNQVESNKSSSMNLVQLAQSLNLTTFVSAVISSHLHLILDHEGPFTVFAPTNEAFVKAPSYCKNVPLKDRMKYHVTRGLHPAKSLKNDQELWTLLSHRYLRVNIYKKTKAVTASGRSIILTDQMARNGIIHVIKDEICSIYKGGAMFEIGRCPPLRIFASAVNASGLYSTLNSEDPVTIFAPTNDAIKSLPVDIRRRLMSNATFLKMVILNHVVPQTIYKDGMYDNQVLKSAAGFKLSLSVKSGSVKINGQSKITVADATVQNGVVHSVDHVLLPKNLRLWSL